jgi:predicted nucleic acid-binding protein
VRRLPDVQPDWDVAVRGGQIATCAVVMMEVLVSARTGEEFDAVESELRFLRDISITRSITRAALSAMRALSHRHPLHHRVPAADLLVAACAQDAGLGVLHYDRHFDRLAEVMDFESRWIAAAGSL